MVIVIMGVSGSGKTVVGKALAARLCWTFEDADDWHSASDIYKMQHAIPLTDEDRLPWIQSLASSIKQWLAAQQNVVLACSALRKSYRETLRKSIPRQRIQFAYLKGSYEEIDARLRRRVGHFMPESLLRSQFQTLEEPDSSEALWVNIDQSVLEIVSTIVKCFNLKR
ncbi:MAG: gluconokinase [Candidatus Acidiferrales bacterium]